MANAWMIHGWPQVWNQHMFLEPFGPSPGFLGKKTWVPRALRRRNPSLIWRGCVLNGTMKTSCGRISGSQMRWCSQRAPLNQWKRHQSRTLPVTWLHFCCAWLPLRDHHSPWLNHLESRLPSCTAFPRRKHLLSKLWLTVGQPGNSLGSWRWNVVWKSLPKCLDWNDCWNRSHQSWANQFHRFESNHQPFCRDWIFTTLDCILPFVYIYLWKLKYFSRVLLYIYISDQHSHQVILLVVSQSCTRAGQYKNNESTIRTSINKYIYIYIYIEFYKPRSRHSRTLCWCWTRCCRSGRTPPRLYVRSIHEQMVHDLIYIYSLFPSVSCPRYGELYSCDMHRAYLIAEPWCLHFRILDGHDAFSRFVYVLVERRHSHIYYIWQLFFLAPAPKSKLLPHI